MNWKLPQPLPAALKVPQLLLQPLLENAVYHGIQPSISGGWIEVELAQEGQAEDNGAWWLTIRNSKPEGSGEAGNRLAHNNIRARLAALDEQARLEVDDLGGEYIARLRLPQAAADGVTTVKVSV